VSFLGNSLDMIPGILKPLEAQRVITCDVRRVSRHVVPICVTRYRCKVKLQLGVAKCIFNASVPVADAAMIVNVAAESGESLVSRQRRGRA
jgi:hypothetical protein